jgi:predicted MFS family arabinose efflux permease
MAGGMAFGSPLGAMIVPFVGWQGLFLFVGVASAAVLTSFPKFDWMTRILALATGARTKEKVKLDVFEVL